MGSFFRTSVAIGVVLAVTLLVRCDGAIAADQNSAADQKGAAEKKNSQRQTAADRKKQSADRTAKAKNKSRKPNAPQVRLDPETEANVVEMVKSHLPEIEALLDRLREKEPQQYAVAIRDLSKSLRRLQLAERRGAEALEIEIRTIKAQSSINLLIARLKLRDDAKDRKSLLAATRDLESAELAKLDFDARTLKARLAKLKDQIANVEKRYEQKKSSIEKQIENDYRSYLRKAGHE